MLRHQKPFQMSLYFLHRWSSWWMACPWWRCCWISSSMPWTQKLSWTTWSTRFWSLVSVAAISWFRWKKLHTAHTLQVPPISAKGFWQNEFPLRGRRLLLFVVCRCLSFVIVCRLSLFVVCPCLSFVIVCHFLSLFVVVCCLLCVVVYLLLLFVLCRCLSFVIVCRLFLLIKGASLRSHWAIGLVWWVFWWFIGHRGKAPAM